MTVKEFLPFIENNIHIVIFKPNITKESLFAQLDDWQYDNYNDFVESIDCETLSVAYSFYTPFSEKLPYSEYHTNITLYNKSIEYEIAKIDVWNKVILLFTK